MDLVRLVYFSENRLDPIDGPVLTSLQNILRVSKRNNEKRDITGALVFDDLWFFQVIEGRRTTVWSTFKTIIDDPRNGNAVLVESVPARSRLFGDWSMRMTKRGASFDPYVRGNVVRPELMSGMDILEAMGGVTGFTAIRPQPLAIAV